MNDQTPTVTMGDLRKRRITAAFRALLGYVMSHSVTRPSSDVVAATAARLTVDLTESERITLIELILSSFPPDLAEDVVAACFADNGWPVSFQGNAMSDARYWAADASASELKAYAVACFDRMSKTGRAAFVKWAQEKSSDA